MTGTFLENLKSLYSFPKIPNISNFPGLVVGLPRMDIAPL